MSASPRAAARVVIGAAVAGWLLLVGLVLSHDVFVTNDSLNSYAHVWYISQTLKESQTLPFNMPVLGHGEALAYPYGFIPWTLAAFGRLIAGDWAVTLTLVGGVALLAGATFWALPELRGPEMAPFVLFNPFLVESFILAQLPFLWAATFFFAAIAIWRRGRTVAAMLVCGASLATHPAVMMPLSTLLVMVALRFETNRWGLARAYAGAVAIAAPAAVVLLMSPTLAEAGRSSALLNLFGTVSVRSPVFLVPIGAALWGKRPGRWVPLMGAALALLLLPMVPLREDSFAWEGLVRRPSHAAEEWTKSAGFQPGATYRVLRARDGKVSMYDVLLAGGRLDSEFFPEGMHRHSFADAGAYSDFLARRRVDFVVMFDNYARAYSTNEAQLLQDRVTSGESRIVFQGAGFRVFKVAPVRALHQGIQTGIESPDGEPAIDSSVSRSPSTSGVGRSR